MSIVIPPPPNFRLEDRGADWAYVCKLCGDVDLVAKDICGDFMRAGLAAHICSKPLLPIITGEK